MSLTGKNDGETNAFPGDNNDGIENADQSAIKPKEKKKNSPMDLLMGPMGTDGLPPYLMCQPCSPEDYDSMAGPNLQAIGEDQPLDAAAESQAVQRTREEHIRDLRALYEASAAYRDQLPALDYSDPLLKEFEAQYEYTQQLAQQIMYEQQHYEEYEKAWRSADHWAKAFGINLDEKYDENIGEKQKSRPKDTSKSGLGHKETIFGASFSEDGKYIATACQDATIGIWEVAGNRLVSTIKAHDVNFECLRVDWANRIWAEGVLDRSTTFTNLIASGGADGIVKIWACQDKEGLDEEGRQVIDNNWKCQYTLDHANLASFGSQKLETLAEEKSEDTDENEGAIEGEKHGDRSSKDDKPQVYALQFIDHWNIFRKDLSGQVCSRHSPEEIQARKESEDDNLDKNSFLMTSSDEFIHLWEIESHSLDEQLEVGGRKIRILQDKMKLKEVMSLHFGSLDDYTYGVTVCSVTGTGMKLPPPPSKHRGGKDDKIAFGGPRNPDNTIFVFDAAYCPGSGLLGVALADGSLRLVNGRGVCISVITLPGNQSHLTSFCWDKTGTRLATCVATGHLITWALDPESHQEGNYNTTATCTAIFEGGHQNGRPLYGSHYCGGEDENLLLSWGVDGKMCMWYANAQGNIYDPVAVLRDDGGYPIYTAAVSPSERNVVVGGGSDGGFIGVPLHFYGIPPVEKRIAEIA